MITVNFPYGTDARLRKERRRLGLTHRITIKARNGMVRAKGVASDLILLKLAF